MMPNDATLSFESAASRLSITMLLVGILVYAGIPYSNIPFGQHWPIKSTETSLIFDLLFVISNYVRMPLLILLSGFVYSRLTSQGFHLKKFIFQYASCLFLTMIMVIPPAWLGFAYFEFSGSNRPFFWTQLPWQQIVERYPPMLHVWYLYYAILFAIGTHSISWLRIAFPANSHAPVRKSLCKTLSAWWGKIVLLIVPTTAAILLFDSALLEASIRLQPDYRVFFGHFPLFLFGIYLNRNKMEWCNLAKQWHRWLAVFVVSLLLNLTINYLNMAQIISLTTKPWHIAAGLSYALCTWSGCLMLLGLFARYFNRTNRRLADSETAARFAYLMHVPLVIWLPILLMGVSANMWIKYAATLIVTLLVCYFIWQIRRLLFVLKLGYLVFASTLLGACSFNSTFFPKDLRAEPEIEQNHTP